MLFNESVDRLRRGAPTVVQEEALGDSLTWAETRRGRAHAAVSAFPTRLPTVVCFKGPAGWQDSFPPLGELTVTRTKPRGCPQSQRRDLAP